MENGKRTSFVGLINEYKKIKIPIIQRDYAQGRKSAEVVRNSFLDALHGYLLEEKPNRDLDFVYGSIEDDCFVPLDGQQRLTTLFLLHWYLSLKENRKNDFRAIMLNNGKSKFSYETRTSSTDFCNALVNADDIEYDKLINNSVKSTIQDTKWYFSSWQYDPTINAMLNMLDAIHEKFKNSTGFYDKLVHPEQPIITFLFLDLGILDLSNDLYIKMNSRGKPLTTFENFKANFEDYLEVEQIKTILDISPHKTVQKYFSDKIDTDWLNLFWKITPKKIDNIADTPQQKDDDIALIVDRNLMNFIKTLAVNYCAITSQENATSYFLNTDADNIHFHNYIEYECFSESFILDMIQLFDLFNNKGTLQNYGVDKYFYDEEKNFNTIIIEQNNDKKLYRERIQFFAYCQYLLRWDTYGGLNDWMRVIVNLSKNTTYNRPDQFMSAMKTVSLLADNSNDILSHLSQNANTSSLSGFIPKQVEEEIIKAKLILKNDEWSALIRETEKKLPYFECQLTHLLAFSDIYSFHDVNKNVDWEESSDKEYFEKFKNYSEKSESLFDAEKLKFEENHLFVRALLCFGDYLLDEGRNYSFLIRSDRDISWKRYLLGDKHEGIAKRQYFHQLIDNEYFNVDNITDSLEKIIAEKKNNINDWRRYFIDTPELFNDLENKKYLRFNGNIIYLLAKERTSGTHSELYTRAFFLNNQLNKKEYSYHSVSGESIEPYFGFTWNYDQFDYEIKIESDYDAQSFILKFILQKDWEAKDFITILTAQGLTKSENEDCFKLVIDKNELFTKLQTLRDELNKLLPNT